MTPSHTLRVVLFREGDFWLAQGLERDVGAQGDNLRDLIARFALVLAAEPALSELPPALPYFQHLWPNRGGDLIPNDDLIGGLPNDLTIDFAVVA